jgi:hypothetical protein
MPSIAEAQIEVARVELAMLDDPATIEALRPALEQARRRLRAAVEAERRQERLEQAYIDSYCAPGPADPDPEDAPGQATAASGSDPASPAGGHPTVRRKRTPEERARFWADLKILGRRRHSLELKVAAVREFGGRRYLELPE